MGLCNAFRLCYAYYQLLHLGRLLLQSRNSPGPIARIVFVSVLVFGSIFYAWIVLMAAALFRGLVLVAWAKSTGSEFEVSPGLVGAFWPPVLIPGSWWWVDAAGYLLAAAVLLGGGMKWRESIRLLTGRSS